MRDYREKQNMGTIKQERMMIMALCISEQDYEKVIAALRDELRLVKQDVQRASQERQLITQNIQFELQILLHALTEFTQYDEDGNVILVNLSEQNKNRLIGFLLSKL